MRSTLIGAWAGAAIVAALPALGEQRLAAAGLWSAYSADDNNMSTCGIATAGAEGRRIAIEQ